MSDLHLTRLQEATKTHILEVLNRKMETQQCPEAYLLADEVGLGKTKVTAAVIRELAKLKEKKNFSEKQKEILQNKRPDRFIVYYLCGSQRVVDQNVAALRRDCHAGITKDERLSKQLNQSYQGKILILPVTPATTFTNKNSDFEQKEWEFLVSHWDLLEYTVHQLWKRDDWRSKLSGEAAAGDCPWQEILKDGKPAGRWSKNDHNDTENNHAKELFLYMRTAACLYVLEGQLPPDLVVLDEFQNYDGLLYDHNEKYPLFTQLLKKTPRLLLLSATPHRMLTGEVRNLKYRDVLTETADSTDTNLRTQNQEEEANTAFSVHNESFDKVVQFVLDPLHPEKPAGKLSEQEMYEKVFCRTERSMFYDTQIKDEPVDTKYITVEQAAAHIRRVGAQYEELKKLTIKKATADRILAYEKKAPDYPCFATRYLDIKNWYSDEEYRKKWEDDLFHLSEEDPGTHAKYALLRDQVLPSGAEAMLWVPPVLWEETPVAGIDLDQNNPFARNRDYTKTLVFGDYRMTTAAPVWYLRRDVRARQEAWIGHPARRTLDQARLKVLQAYYESCFAGQSEKVKSFVENLLQQNNTLVEAVTGLQGEAAWWYYAAQGRLKNVLEEYGFLLGGNDELGKTLPELQKCQAMRLKVFGQPAETEAGPCTLAERFTVDDTDSGAHKETHSRAMQKRFNSPFWPFVLTASSVAQEGLDFHWYSHAIAHWSLPKTPVEYMQREGRIDRYLSHLVRKRMHLLFPEETTFADLKEQCLTAVQNLGYDVSRPLYPYWYIGGEDFENLKRPKLDQLPRFRRLVCALPLSSEWVFWGKLQKAMQQYNVHLGPSYQADTHTARRFCPLLLSLEKKAGKETSDL